MHDRFGATFLDGDYRSIWEGYGYAKKIVLWTDGFGRHFHGKEHHPSVLGYCLGTFLTGFGLKQTNLLFG